MAAHNFLTAGDHGVVDELYRKFLEDPHSVPKDTARAFASLLDFVTWSRKCLAEQGVWMAMKGKHPADEIAALPAGVEVFHVEPLVVPGLDAERCILWLRPAVSV